MGIENNYIVKVTLSCPAQCECCTNRQKQFKKNVGKTIFDISSFEKVCNYIKSHGGEYVSLSGGEPTMISNLSDYISIAHRLGLATRINTNGWNVTEDNLVEWGKKGLDQIVLSIYGLEEEKVRALRGNETLYDKSILAARNIRKYKETNNLIFIVQTVLMKQSFEDLPQILDFAIKNKADRLWPSYLEDAHNLPSIRMSNVDVEIFNTKTISEMRDVISRSTDLSENVKKNLYISITQYFDADYTDGIYHRDGKPCFWKGRHFSFYPDGRVDPCPGHEYFTSSFQHKIDYDRIEDGMDIMQEETEKFSYCRYCPQGVHKELILSDIAFHEHSRKEILRCSNATKDGN